jgi:hypothetical protein
MSYNSEGLIITQSTAETKLIADASGTRVVNTVTNESVAEFNKNKVLAKEIECEGQISANKLRIIPGTGDNDNTFKIVINN